MENEKPQTLPQLQQSDISAIEKIANIIEALLAEFRPQYMTVGAKSEQIGNWLEFVGEFEPEAVRRASVAWQKEHPGKKPNAAEFRTKVVSLRVVPEDKPKAPTPGPTSQLRAVELIRRAQPFDGPWASPKRIKWLVENDHVRQHEVDAWVDAGKKTA